MRLFGIALTAIWSGARHIHHKTLPVGASPEFRLCQPAASWQDSTTPPSRPGVLNIYVRLGSRIPGVSLSTAVQPDTHVDVQPRPGPAGKRAAGTTAPAKLRLRECLELDSPFVAMTAEVAHRERVDARALRIRTLLHLPRIAGYSGLMPGRLVTAELVRVARQLAGDVRETADSVPAGAFELRDLVFAPVPAKLAAPIIVSRHYLRSARPDSQYYALLDPMNRQPVSMCSVSPLQWRRVAGQINTRFGIPRERIWDVSRVYSCDSAPTNSISYLLARVRTALRRSEVGVDLLTTAVDTNLGFSGASYRAANWQPWMTVQPRPYLYHNLSYASPRQLRLRYGTSAIAELQRLYPGETFEQSRVKLRESLIFCWRVRRETELIPEDSRLPIRR
jgi:hypothetical protein